MNASCCDDFNLGITHLLKCITWVNLLWTIVDNLTVTITPDDGNLTTRRDADRARIEIWEKDNDDVVVYDYQVACSVELEENSKSLHRDRRWVDQRKEIS